MRHVSVLCLLLVSCLAALAQNDRGTITGEVKDQGGAVIPNATVVVTNNGTGAMSKTTTTETGNYTIPSLSAGVYTLHLDLARCFGNNQCDVGRCAIEDRVRRAEHGYPDREHQRATPELWRGRWQLGQYPQPVLRSICFRLVNGPSRRVFIPISEVSGGIGRTFRVGEKKSLEGRAEFFNLFNLYNRMELNGPTVTTPQGARSCSVTVPTPGLANSVNVAVGSNSCPAGYSPPSGYGAISYTGLAIQPRNGQIVARLLSSHASAGHFSDDMDVGGRR